MNCSGVMSLWHDNIVAALLPLGARPSPAQ